VPLNASRVTCVGIGNHSRSFANICEICFIDGGHGRNKYRGSSSLMEQVWKTSRGKHQLVLRLQYKKAQLSLRIAYCGFLHVNLRSTRARVDNVRVLHSRLFRFLDSLTYVSCTWSKLQYVACIAVRSFYRPSHHRSRASHKYCYRGIKRTRHQTRKPSGIHRYILCQVCYPCHQLIIEHTDLASCTFA